MAKMVLVMGGEDTSQINGGTWFTVMFTRNISHKRLQFANISQNLSVQGKVTKNWHNTNIYSSGLYKAVGNLEF
jgi:hypothetical protein